MSQSIGLRAIESRLNTRRAIERYNELAEDYNRLCAGYEASRSDRDAARSAVESAEASIAAAALEDIERLNADATSIRRTQELLDALGYEPGTIDGVYGTQTGSAIEAFQKEAGLPVDGLVSEDLLRDLRAALTADLRSTYRRPREETAQAVNVVILVTDATSRRVPDAQVTISGVGGFRADRSTDEQGTAEFGAVPVGRFEIDVRRDVGGSRFTLQVTEDPRQEVLIVLPGPSTPESM